MSSRQRELRTGMIKGRWLPGGCSVANRANVIEIILHMVRVRDRIVITLMAGVTGCRSVLVAAGVTGVAGHRDMGAG